MVYKKYIKRGGKTYGPYAYHSKKVDGKVITEYHGKHGEKKDSIHFLYVGTVILLFFILGFFVMGNVFQEESDLNPFLKNLIEPSLLLMPADANGVYIDPVSQLIDQGNPVSIDIMGQVPGITTDIYSIQFDVVYDSSLLTLNSVTEGDLLKTGGVDTVFDYDDSVSGVIEDIYIARNSTLGVVADGVFVEINFTTSGVLSGVADLAIANVIWVNSTVTNDSADTIVPVVENGNITVNFIAPVCGDGVIEGAEECDDSGTTPGDGCDAGCQIETGWECINEPSECNLLCGNGNIDSGEDCDGGNLNGQDCIGLGYDGGSLTCDGACSFDTSSCVAPPVIVTVDSTYNSPSYDKDNLIDTIMSTTNAWASCDGDGGCGGSSGPHWVALNFSTSQTIGNVTIWWGWNNGRGEYMGSQQVDVEYWDGNVYQPINSIVLGDGNITNSSLSFTPVDTPSLRFWQPLGMGPSPYSSVMWLSEIEWDTGAVVAASCDLTNANWSDVNVVENTQVTLIVQGTNCADGTQVNFTIYEDDGFGATDSPNNQPGLGSFSSGVASVSWTAEYQPDGILGINDPPEYYFDAFEVANTTNIITSSAPLLEVSEIPTGDNEMYVDVTTPVVDQGQQVVININGRAPTDASDVYGIQFDVVYDSSNLTFVPPVAEGDLLDGDGASILFGYDDSVPGRVADIYILRNGTQTGIHTNDGVFATLTFNAIGAGTSDIILENWIWANSSVTNDTVGIPGITVTDGQVTINAVAGVVCGDGVIEGAEECDDSGTTPGDGCDAGCQIETGWECINEPSECNLLCGNGNIDSGEDCDGGNLNGQDCIGLGYDSGSLACDGSCSFDTSSCVVAGLGNLQSQLVTPLVDGSVEQGEFFTFTSNVSCIGGDCGTVSGRLGYEAQGITQTYSCGAACQGTDGCTDNNLGPACTINHRCDGTNTINDISIISSRGQDVGTGETINISVVYNCWTVPSNDSVTIWYHNGVDWRLIKTWKERWGDIGPGCNGNADPLGDGVLSTLFTIDNVVGTHTVRVIENDQDPSWLPESDPCPQPGNPLTDYGDFDDILLNVTETPFYTASSNSQGCGVMGDGNNCETTWQVNAAGAVGEIYSFFTNYYSTNANIVSDETTRINMEIISAQVSCTDNDGDGYNQSAAGCGAVDCDDVPGSGENVNPGETEVCNGVDDDCVGGIDDNLVSPFLSTQDGVCNGYNQTCSGVGGWIEDYAGVPNYEASEISCDNLDNDCDGSVDETYTDCSGGTPYCEVGFCVACILDSHCDNGVYCDGAETCDLNVCQEASDIDCSGENLIEIASCTNTPDDGLDFTWDYASTISGVCNENIDQCEAGGVQTVSSTCNITCGSGCEQDSDCSPTLCGTDECIGPDWYDYTDVSNTCDTCFCTTNACGSPSISYDDPACTGLCVIDEDCDSMDQDYCTLDDLMHDEGVCNAGTCEVQTTTTSDCNSGDNFYCNGTEIWTDDGFCNVNMCDISSSFTQECVDSSTCNGTETCFAGSCQQTAPVDCSGEDVLGIGTCDNSPDDNPFTWDFLPAFTSQCVEPLGGCTQDTNSVTSSCDITRGCGATCDVANPCFDMCVGDTLYTVGGCNSDCGCDYGITLDCNLDDGWYNAGNTRWVDVTQCTEKEQEEQHYLNYSCGGAACSFIIEAGMGTQWVDTGATQNKANGFSCDDGTNCFVNDVCTFGVCGGSLRTDCDDGIGCSSDFCNVTSDVCEADVTGCECPGQTDAECDNSIFCDGTETCNILTLTCANGMAPACGDGDSCTVDSCNETTDSCDNIPEDADGDGFNITAIGCGLVDCNDSDAAINPGAIEICDDLIDNDCDTFVDVNDTDCGFVDTDAPVFDNLRNFVHFVNVGFAESITASDASGVASYSLNDTSVFDIDGAGLITNSTSLGTIGTYWFNLSVDDPLGYETSGEFYIMVSGDVTAPNITITAPSPGQTFTTPSADLRVTTDENATCNYTLNAGVANYTMVPDANNTGFLASTTLTNSGYVGKFYCWDLVGNLATKNVSFSVNYVAPTDDGDSPSVGPSSGDPTPSSGFVIDNDELSVSLEQGEDTAVNFNIENIGKSNLDFTLSSDSNLVQLVSSSFSVAPGEIKSVWMNVITEEDTVLDLYTANINLVAGGIQDEVVVSVEVVSRGSLFDIVLDINEEDLEIVSGEEMDISLSLTRLFGTPGESVTLNYIIKDEEGNEVYFEQEEKIIEDSLVFDGSFLIPDGLDLGKYVFYVQAEYQDKIASASTWFDITPAEKAVGFAKWLRENLWRVVILLSALTIVFVILIIYFKKRKEENSMQQGLSGRSSGIGYLQTRSSGSGI